MTFDRRLSKSLLISTVLWSTQGLTQVDGDPEAAARVALADFLQAFNSADLDRVRNELNYPHVTHGPQGLIIAETADDFRIDFDAMQERGWRGSRWDRVTTRQVSADKVNFSVDFARLGTDGEPYIEGNVFYVFTLRDGHWGMQYRAGDRRRGRYPQAQLDTARRGATDAVSAFFAAFNAADTEALARVHHVPQAVIAYQDNRFLSARTSDSPLLRPNFAALRSREGWQRSEFDSLSVVSATPDRVILELEFQRINNQGQAYLRIPALWVFAQREGRWGMEFRSLMRSTLTTGQ